MATPGLRTLTFSLSKGTTGTPEFLVPCLARSRPAWQVQLCSFSTSSTRPYPRDRNKLRGMSPMRGTGLRQPLSVSKLPLPKPVLDPAKRSKPQGDPDHGLWGFFNQEKTALPTPEEDSKHGRPWTAEELRRKSWEDLHSLWWICVRERNKIWTSWQERDRLKAGYGDHEASERDQTVRRTQKAIKHVLTERWYAWESARKLGMKDAAIDLTGEGPAFLPYDPSYEQR